MKHGVPHFDSQSDELQVMPLAEEHLIHFGDILQSAVQKEHQRFVIDNQHGYLDYLRLIIRFPESFPHHHLRVIAEPHGPPTAFADFRMRPPTAGFLSSLVVFPQFRGLGLSTRLFTAFANEFPHVTALGLDVFASNAAAIGLYTSIGFATTATHYWLTREVRPGPHRISIPDLPQSIGMHSAYGFTSFIAENKESHGRVGLIGDEVINCFEAQAFTDREFLSSIAQTFEGRNIAFHSTPNLSMAEDAGVRCANTSVRMELTSLSDLRSR